MSDLILITVKRESKCDEHHWHLTRNGTIKTSSPCWYPVTCCRCGESNHMRTDTHQCKFKITNKGGFPVKLGPALNEGRLYREG